MSLLVPYQSAGRAFGSWLQVPALDQRQSALPQPLSLPLPLPLFSSHLCTFAQELRSDLHLCTVSLSCGRGATASRPSTDAREPCRASLTSPHQGERTPRSGAPTYLILPPATRGRHLPPETIPTFALLHRSSAPICTFALSHCLEVGARLRRVRSPSDSVRRSA